VSARRSANSPKSGQPAPSNTRFALDPYFACLIFAAVGLGTLKLGTSPRLIILWTTLIGLWLAFREGQAVQIEYQFRDIGRGAGIGLLIGVPLLLLAFRALATAIPILYVSGEPSPIVGAWGTMIFGSLVLVAPLAEELFFRDILHRERGFWISIGLYAAAGVIFFLPTAGGFPAVLVAVSGATAVLGILYAFLYERYGLTIGLACHTTINLVLLFVPAIVSHLGLFTQGGP
jgi:membrane protease YdiL (CAAX protease family)